MKRVFLLILSGPVIPQKVRSDKVVKKNVLNKAHKKAKGTANVSTLPMENYARMATSVNSVMI